MRIKSILGLTLLLAAAAPAFAADSPFLGKWTASAVTAGGEISETLTVTKTAEGYAVDGKPVVAPPPGSPQATPGTDIVLEGNNFSYKRSIDFGGQAVVITYTGVINGDTFTGEAEIGGMKIPYNGVRIKD